MFPLTDAFPLSWDDVKETSDHRFAFRTEQLELRKREIYLSYYAFRKLVQTGERGDLQTTDELSFDWASWTGDWVRCDEGVSLVGHSFGGATVVSSGASDASPAIAESLSWNDQSLPCYRQMGTTIFASLYRMGWYWTPGLSLFLHLAQHPIIHHRDIPN